MWFEYYVCLSTIDLQPFPFQGVGTWDEDLEEEVVQRFWSVLHLVWRQIPDQRKLGINSDSNRSVDQSVFPLLFNTHLKNIKLNHK